MKTLASFRPRNPRLVALPQTAKLLARCVFWLSAGAALVIGPHEAYAAAKKPSDGRADTKTWEVVYRTEVARADRAKGTCPVQISTNGREWPRPRTDYVWVGLDDSCEASGLAVHDNVTRNNASPDQR